jgi:hypothetical protein
MRKSRSFAASAVAALVLFALLALFFFALPARAEESVGSKVERNLEGAAAATERGLKRAGEATGNAIGTAIDKTGEGVGTAIDKTGEGLERAGEALRGSPPPAHPHEHELRESDLPPEDPALGDSAYDDRTDGVVEPDPEDGE